jgi:hypothetical protein
MRHAAQIDEPEIPVAQTQHHPSLARGAMARERDHLTQASLQPPQGHRAMGTDTRKQEGSTAQTRNSIKK